MSRLVQAYNQMEKFRVLKSRKKAKVQLVLMHEVQCRRYVAAACFSQMRFILRTERDKSGRDMLEKEVIPAIKAAEQGIRDVVHQTQRKNRQRIMHLIMICCVGRIYKCLHHWREVTRLHNDIVIANTARRVAMLHKTRLMDAFTKWVHVQAFEKKFWKALLHERLYAERARMEAELEKATKACQIYENQCRRRARHMATILFMKHYLARLHFRFRRWSKNVNEREHKLNRIGYICVVKRDRRILKVAFNRALAQLRLKRKSDNGIGKGNTY